MGGSALNIQSERMIRQIVRDQKKNVEQQRKDRECRMEKRNQMMAEISPEVTTEITRMNRRMSANNNSRLLKS